MEEWATNKRQACKCIVYRSCNTISGHDFGVMPFEVAMALYWLNDSVLRSSWNSLGRAHTHTYHQRDPHKCWKQQQQQQKAIASLATDKWCAIEYKKKTETKIVRKRCRTGMGGILESFFTKQDAFMVLMLLKRASTAQRQSNRRTCMKKATFFASVPNIVSRHYLFISFLSARARAYVCDIRSSALLFAVFFSWISSCVPFGLSPNKIFSFGWKTLFFCVCVNLLYVVFDFLQLIT